MADDFAAFFFLVEYGLGLVLNVLTMLLEERGARRYERFDDRLKRSRGCFWRASATAS